MKFKFSKIKTKNMKKLLLACLLGFFALAGFKIADAKILTDDWMWYVDNNDGYKIKMPKDWFVKKYYYPQIYTGAAPLRYTTFNSQNEKYYLQLGIKKKTQNLMIAFRTGIGVGDVKKTLKAKIGKKKVWAKFWAYNHKTKEVFFNSDKNTLNILGQCFYNKYELSAMFEPGDEIEYSTLNIKKDLYEYKVAKKMLTTFKTIR